MYLLIDGNWVLCVETEDVCNGMLIKVKPEPNLLRAAVSFVFCRERNAAANHRIESLAERGKMVFEGGLDLVSE